MSRKNIDIGDNFGNFTYLGEEGRDKYFYRLGRFKCDCGRINCKNEIIVPISYIITGKYAVCSKGCSNSIEYEIDNNGCRNCTSHPLGKDKRPRMSRKNKTILVYRYVYEQKYGEIPNGLFCCHKCDNTTCINPDHIFLGNHHDNMMDMCNKNLNKGEKSKYHKLTEKEVKKILYLYEKGYNYKKIWGICNTTSERNIRHIIKGKTRNHI